MTVEDPGGTYIKISRIPMPDDISVQAPFIVIEQHHNGKHDLKRDFRAEIGYGTLAEKNLRRILKGLGAGPKNPVVETDRPSSPITLLSWQLLNDNDKEK